MTRPCACAPGCECPDCQLRRELYAVRMADLPSAHGGSPACPTCQRHSPTWHQPLEQPQQRACQHCGHRWEAQP